MIPISCDETRRDLEAFHDRELPISRQIAVGAHLEWCDRCRAALADLGLVRAAFRARGGRSPVLTLDEAAAFQATVVSRVKAERAASLPERVREMFDDMHLVYAGLGAAAATIACLVIMLGMMRSVSDIRPDSLAAVVSLLATPGSNADAAAIDAASHARWTARFQAASESAEEDMVFALAAIVTHEGRIASLHTVTGRRVVAERQRMIEGLLDAVSRARLDSVPSDGTPASVNVVWLMTHTTVRATAAKTPTLDLPVEPGPRKRAATMYGRLAKPVSA